MPWRRRARRTLPVNDRCELVHDRALGRIADQAREIGAELLAVRQHRVWAQPGRHAAKPDGAERAGDRVEVALWRDGVDDGLVHRPFRSPERRRVAEDLAAY